jgi:hypothetical protein
MRYLFSKELPLDGSRWKNRGGEPNSVYLDIETRQVDAPANWPYRRRWQPFMIGVAGMIDPGIFFVDVVASEDEGELIEFVRENFEGGVTPYEFRYAATREFDEYVLREKFTNARRAHSPVAGSWPNLNGFKCEWRNIRKLLKAPEPRGADVASRDVPEVWKNGREKAVALHCARDVVELALRDPEAKLSPRLETELRRLLAN